MITLLFTKFIWNDTETNLRTSLVPVRFKKGTMERVKNRKFPINLRTGGWGGDKKCMQGH